MLAPNSATSLQELEERTKDRERSVAVVVASVRAQARADDKWSSFLSVATSIANWIAIASVIVSLASIAKALARSSSRAVFRKLPAKLQRRIEELIEKRKRRIGPGGGEEARKPRIKESRVPRIQFRYRKRIPASRANQRYANNPDWEPPHDDPCFDCQLAESETGWVRLYTDGVTDPKGSWFMRAEDIRGLTRQQIRNLWGLPEMPDRVVDVTFERGVKFYESTAARTAFGSGGGLQRELLGGRGCPWADSIPSDWRQVMQIDIRGSTLRMASGAEHDFGRRIVRVLDTGLVFVVLLDAEDGPLMSENVFGLDASARVVWRVQEFEFPNGRSPYTQISQSDDGSIKAYNFSGIMVILDPRSGGIMRSYVAK